MDFECSVFDGKYVTNDVSKEYLTELENVRNDQAKRGKSSDKKMIQPSNQEEEVLGLHNNE